jgi:hypothetical protein
LKKETENCVEAIYQLHRELIYSSNKKVENEVAFSGTCSSAEKADISIRFLLIKLSATQTKAVVLWSKNGDGIN